ncbi:hypothetical protein [Nocardioides houyundeii]|uniref:hypothetical protein n=1 Tax=Nocardioides houyundeii TaxID=2045452 RepID=UPI00131594F0|nr:hypothetical protein [Nocardioides houyundeii]
MSNDRAAARRSPVLTAISLLIVLGTFVAIVRQVSAPVTNTDTYFHLRMGREFLDGWSARSPGTLSQFSTADWVPTQWLGQVGYAAFEQWFGLSGVAWLAGALILAFALTVFLVARAHSSLLVASLITPLTVGSTAPFLSSRPQVASYLFVVLTVGAWLRYRETGAAPWWLVPLTWLWAMVHGMWPVGPALGVLCLLGLALDRAPQASTRRTSRRKALLVPVLSLLAAGLTPVGPALYGGVLRVGNISEYFAEWAPTDFTEVAPALTASVLLLWLVLALRAGSVPWTELGLGVVAAGWLVYSQRTVPLGAAMLVPLLAQRMQRVLPDRPSVGRLEVGVAAGGFVAALAGLALAVPFTSDQPVEVPRAQDQLLRALPPGTGLLNEWDEGGHDVWRYPDLQVVMHGYGDMFTDDELERNVDLLKLAPGWDESLRELGVTHALLYTDGVLTYALTNDKGWRVIEQDERMSYLEAPPDWLDPSAG